MPVTSLLPSFSLLTAGAVSLCRATLLGLCLLPSAVASLPRILTACLSERPTIAAFLPAYSVPFVSSAIHTYGGVWVGYRDGRNGARRTAMPRSSYRWQRHSYEMRDMNLQCACTLTALRDSGSLFMAGRVALGLLPCRSGLLPLTKRRLAAPPPYVNIYVFTT